MNEAEVAGTEESPAAPTPPVLGCCRSCGRYPRLLDGATRICTGLYVTNAAHLVFAADACQKRANRPAAIRAREALGL